MRSLWSTLSRIPVDTRFYVLLTVFSFLFSFSFFYKGLYLLVPGFNSVRVPLRLLEFFQLGLCAIAGHGLVFLLRRPTNGFKKAISLSALFVLFTVENVNSKIPSRHRAAASRRLRLAGGAKQCHRHHRTAFSDQSARLQAAIGLCLLDHFPLDAHRQRIQQFFPALLSLADVVAEK